jgi:hypothetical protein
MTKNCPPGLCGVTFHPGDLDFLGIAVPDEALKEGVLKLVLLNVRNWAFLQISENPVFIPSSRIVGQE